MAGGSDNDKFQSYIYNNDETITSREVNNTRQNQKCDVAQQALHVLRHAECVEVMSSIILKRSK